MFDRRTVLGGVLLALVLLYWGPERTSEPSTAAEVSSLAPDGDAPNTDRGTHDP